MTDPATLAELHARAFVTPAPWSPPQIAALLDDPHVFLCAKQGAFLIGRAVAGEAELLTLATDPDHRRLGLGRALLRAFAEEARRRNATEAFLEVAADNDAARALYASEGWQESGRRPRYYRAPDGTRLDALIFTAKL